MPRRYEQEIIFSIEANLVVLKPTGGNKMKNTKLHLLLADDDIDDCDFFRDAIDEISDTFELTVLNNGG